MEDRLHWLATSTGQVLCLSSSFTPKYIHPYGRWAVTSPHSGILMVSFKINASASDV